MTAMILLTGCGQKVFKTQLEVYCPPIVSYSEDFNEELADELQSLPSESDKIPEALADYALLRDTIRNCTKTREHL